MKIAVVYKSEYGGSKQYAQWIAGALEADMFALSKKTPDMLAAYDAVIFGAGLYAGGINGSSVIKKNFRKLRDKHLILFTVGISDTERPEKFKPIIDRCFTSEMHARIKVFHFRGFMDYTKLSGPHRLMMRVLVAALSRKKPDKLTNEEKTIIATYGKAINFMDEAAIEPLLTYVCALESL